MVASMAGKAQVTPLPALLQLLLQQLGLRISRGEPSGFTGVNFRAAACLTSNIKTYHTRDRGGELRREDTALANV